MSLISRRKFAVVAGLAGLGGILKSAWSRPQTAKAHIESRRLLNFAEGRIKLADWERQHLHQCEVCQAMVCVFMRQPI
ncbi:MAG TPA: hypothetical protein VE422_04550 [Terriglobia bacterium]|nr:hypothetical protein [Terriglobia bacterium]